MQGFQPPFPYLSEYSGQVNDAVRSSATATEFLATDGNPVLQGGEDVIKDQGCPKRGMAQFFLASIQAGLDLFDGEG